LITALELARLGRTVWCVDIHPGKLENLRQGIPPFEEPGLRTLLAEMIGLGRLRFATNYDDAIPESGFVFIALPTPSPADSDRAYDMRAIHDCIDDMVRCGLGPQHSIVMKSTVPCGTGREITGRLAARGLDVPYISCPEFLREGTALGDAEAPDRILIGDSGQPQGAVLAEIFRGRGENGERISPGINFGTLQRIEIESAELVKLASNGWLATQIGVINEIANLSDAVRADIVEVVELIARAQISKAFLNAGIGFAGPCFPKDVHGLRGVAIDAGVPFELLDAVLAANRAQPEQAVGKARRALGTLEGKVVGLLGASFKAGTSDTRESMAVVLIQGFVASGARVVVFDPKAKRFEANEQRRLPDHGWEFAEDIESCLGAADIAVVATNWPEFDEIAWGTRGTRVHAVVDGRNVLDPRRVTDAGLNYDGIGRRVLGREPSERLQGAELAAFAETAALSLLAIKKSFMAEMALIAERVGANWENVADGIALDQRIGTECVTRTTLESAELDSALDDLLARASASRCRMPVAAHAARTRVKVRTQPAA
jgi:UDPglucose 6-dehydrogenase